MFGDVIDRPCVETLEVVLELWAAPQLERLARVVGLFKVAWLEGAFTLAGMTTSTGALSQESAQILLPFDVANWSARANCSKTGAILGLIY